MGGTETWLKRPMRTIKKYSKMSLQHYKNLNLYGKAFFWSFILLIGGIIVAAIILKPSRIAQFFYDRSHQVAEYRFGFLLFYLGLVVVSFPPMIGHTTLSTLCGFTYGLNGFFITAAGSLTGTCLSFLLCRYLFSKKVHSWSDDNPKWQALEAVIRAKGLPLIVLIRICPFPPWAYSSVFFSSIEAVSLWQFAAATACLFPKFLLYAFIGSRMAALSDGNQRVEMDTQTKIINSVVIAGGFVAAIITGIVMYKLVQREVRNLESLPTEVDRDAADVLDEIDEGAPLLRDFS